MNIPPLLRNPLATALVVLLAGHTASVIAQEPDSVPQIKVESKFIEADGENWIKLIEENQALKDLNFKLPELDQEAPTLDMLKNKLNKTDDNTWVAPGKIDSFSVLSDEAFQTMVKGINQTKHANMLSSPVITTKDGLRGVIEMGREFRYPGEENKDEKPVITKQLGIQLEVVPKLKQDGDIALEITPTTTSLLGYVFEKDGVKTLFLDKPPGPKDPMNPQLPAFMVVTGKITVAVHPGKTVVMGCARYEKQATGNGEKIITKVLLIFITAKIAAPEDMAKPARLSPSPGPAAMPPPAPLNENSKIPYAAPVDGRPGFVTSPFAPDQGYIDVRGFPQGTEVKDPYTGKTFLVP